MTTPTLASQVPPAQFLRAMFAGLNVTEIARLSGGEQKAEPRFAQLLESHQKYVQLDRPNVNLFSKDPDGVSVRLYGKSLDDDATPPASSLSALVMIETNYHTDVLGVFKDDSAWFATQGNVIANYDNGADEFADVYIRALVSTCNTSVTLRSYSLDPEVPLILSAASRLIGRFTSLRVKPSLAISTARGAQA